MKTINFFTKKRKLQQNPQKSRVWVNLAEISQLKKMN